jgi:hypothetical protein
VAFDDGFVAIVRAEYGPESTPAILRSKDGANWNAAAPFPEGNAARAADLAGGVSVVVAVGTLDLRAAAVAPVLGLRIPDQRQAIRDLADVCQSEPPDGTGAAWWSTDGATWMSAEGDGFDLGPIRAVTSHAGGFVAVTGFNTGSVDLSASWTSADGRAWTPAGHAPSLRAGIMQDVAAHGSSIVAVGGSECLTQLPSAWWSADGLTWKVTELGNQGDARLVAVGPRGFLAAGWSGDDEAPEAAWLAADGRSWDAVTLPPDAGLVRDLVGLPDRYLLVTENGVVWSSRDGSAWTEVLSPTDGMVQRLAANATQVIAIGTIRTDDPEVNPGAVWTAPLSDLP